ncbi:uncharacterized protein M6B38_411405 [Iris pallida]|uniref:Uncharacterized protein n=1 Tax=Iris pallida TaxID=29817 RepID=A0AAX6FMH2_IRIPA|nr:uncharacterized protein M6B38_411405 [Iris pallida]
MMTQVIPENRKPLPLTDPDPDMPAESVRIRIDDDGVLQWLDNLHPVYDRDDSTKGTTNPKSHHNHHHQHQQNPNPNSQRFSGNLKATTKAQIIGLPGAGAAVQHSGHIGHSARRPPPPIFPPKKPRVASSSLSDPVSPKVSCFGKVQSERRRSDSSAEGCWLGLLAWFGRREPVSAAETATPPVQRNIPARLSMDVPAAEPPGIGGMKRFVSGRRSASWGGDVEVDLDGGEDGHVPWSGPLLRR